MKTKTALFAIVAAIVFVVGCTTHFVQPTLGPELVPVEKSDRMVVTQVQPGDYLLTFTGEIVRVVTNNATLTIERYTGGQVQVAYGQHVPRQFLGDAAEMRFARSFHGDDSWAEQHFALQQ